MTNFIK